MPMPEPKRKKPLKLIRPNALIIRPAEKAKYAEILRRIKKDVSDEQVRTTVDKINKTRSGDLLITISRKSVDKGQGLQQTIANILKEEAKAALHTVTKELCEIPPETIKIRKAYRGTQTAVVTLPAAAAQKILEESGKIRIGWVNCRIRATRKPTQCYKCWHFGHHGSQCRSKTDRSKLCIRCGQEGHKIADCKNPPKCVLCAENKSAENAAHHAGTYRCPLNLNHCEAAHDLLVQTVRELELDLVIIAEPYRHLNNQPWETDSTTKAVIWSCGKLPFQSIVSNDSIGFVAASINDIRFYSCYAPPSLSIADFTDFLDRLTEDAKQYYPVAIAGDFNSWAVDWGSKQTNARGKALREAMASLDVVLLNIGGTPTYTKGEASSIIDLTFVSSSLLKGNYSWEVLNTYTGSDHSAILWEISAGRNPQRATRQTNAAGWKVKDFDSEALVVALDIDSTIITGNAVEKTKNLMTRIAQACDTCMPRKRGINKRPSVHWWNDQINALRTACHKKRRLSQRGHRRPNSAELVAEYKKAHRELNNAIKDSKRRCWKELVDEVEKDPWGRPPVGSAQTPYRHSSFCLH
ncbi:uncharacterized protein LOC123264033 [Cotesia glomerata]|uniref:uncharacterized protein LOC123264033 n=1 Tax=Cotesia glomerata TaxID=32391 RepID=UPI001D007D7E|nr:uncharacterized protein LOC123264033 [Cotesia glomerata]